MLSMWPQSEKTRGWTRQIIELWMLSNISDVFRITGNPT